MTANLVICIKFLPYGSEIIWGNILEMKTLRSLWYLTMVFPKKQTKKKTPQPCTYSQNTNFKTSLVTPCSYSFLNTKLPEWHFKFGANLSNSFPEKINYALKY